VTNERTRTSAGFSTERAGAGFSTMRASYADVGVRPVAELRISGRTPDNTRVSFRAASTRKSRHAPCEGPGA
ncbi:MAG: hypothetical protein SFX73_14100, partial [Kofleriaceae bacterium]|nr:hypothetical protein [Kofleriaceae bacterium]